MGILNDLPGLQENISLANHTTFRIGGPARYFFIAKNNDEIIRAVQSAKEENIPFYIMGGGSNLLVNDEGFDGLVIKISNNQYSISNGKIIAEAGVSLIKIIMETAKNGYSGLEWGFGIPGTIGGAVFGNAGAYGHSISESVEKVKILNDKFQVSSYKFQDCQFGYRNSIFKKKDEIILEVTLKLEKGDREESQQVIKKIVSERKGKIPPYPSAGSVFKNYEVKSKNCKEDTLIKSFSTLLAKVKGDKIPTGYLIEQCGLKGKQIGRAKIADEHANFIVNLGGAKAKDVVALINLCKEKVEEKFGIELKEEIRYLGF